MAFNFTFADNQRLGLQIVGANSTGTSEQPLCFKRAVVDNDNNVAGEVMFVGKGEQTPGRLGLCYGFVFASPNGKPTLKEAAGTPIVGVCIKDDNLDYIQTGGIAYVQVDAPLNKGNKVYLIAASHKVSSSASGNVEIIGAFAGDPAAKITVKIGEQQTPTDLYPIYLNNPHL